MASYQGQTRTVYTEAQRKQKSAELASEPVVIETESKQDPVKRGRKPKDV